MAVFKEIKISFGGSFQCRLATESDPTDASLKDPFGDLGAPASKGWTFAYDEPRFDRIIRCQTPVALRNALVNPWEPVKVNKIEVKPEPLFPFPGTTPWQTIPADPLLNLPVSLGDQAKFDTSAGEGMSHEAILPCRVTFGDVLTATPVGKPVLKGFEPEGEVEAWRTEYATKKPAAILAAVPSMHPTRLKVLTPSPTAPRIYFDTYKHYFSLAEVLKPINANVDFIPAGATGILAMILTGWTWTLHLTFSRFDGDTLVGRVEGDLSGIHSDL
jgi:hypothetical protein